MKALLFYIDGHACADAVSNVGKNGNIIETSVEVLQIPATNIVDDGQDGCDQDDSCDGLLSTTYLHPTESETETESLYSFWNNDQFAEIQMVALKALSRLGSNLLSDVMSLCVVNKLLKFISVASTPCTCLCTIMKRCTTNFWTGMKN